MPAGVSYLNSRRLGPCLMAGLERLTGEREYLNRINVFPVPDGDTGNNLAQTAQAGMRGIADYRGTSVRELLATLANSTLDGAQGNSGALLAQFMQGLADNVAAEDRLLPDEFATAFNAAALGTRSALTAPREGTIITIMDAAAGAALAGAVEEDFACMLAGMCDAANKALLATKGQLPELRRAGVVDAGAAGFCALLEGCMDYMARGTPGAVRQAATEVDYSAVAAHEQTVDLSFRYCTECMLLGTALDPASVRTALEPLGNSLVVAGSASRLRIHIHCNDPEEVFELAGQLGTVENTKADDMIGQARSLGRSDRRIAIVTDSAADLPDNLPDNLNIHIVPLRVQFGHHTYLDKIGITPAEFRHELASNPERPGTSQPTAGDFRRMYEFLTTHFEEVLSIHLSGRLSGTFQAACNVAAQIDRSAQIRVIDSANASVGQGLIVKRAAELAAAGTRGEALFNAVEREIRGTRSFALVTNLDAAVRSGRVRPAIKRLADWLKLNPVLMNTRGREDRRARLSSRPVAPR